MCDVDKWQLAWLVLCQLDMSYRRLEKEASGKETSPQIGL